LESNRSVKKKGETPAQCGFGKQKHLNPGRAQRVREIKNEKCLREKGRRSFPMNDRLCPTEDGKRELYGIANGHKGWPPINRL